MTFPSVVGVKDLKNLVSNNVLEFLFSLFDEQNHSTLNDQMSSIVALAFFQRFFFRSYLSY